tara:strand:- start:270 stop:764 length:495 start_codon:yes stop_codon:yes gene_type:complete
MFSEKRNLILETAATMFNSDRKVAGESHQLPPVIRAMKLYPKPVGGQSGKILTISPPMETDRDRGMISLMISKLLKENDAVFSVSEVWMRKIPKDELEDADRGLYKRPSESPDRVEAVFGLLYFADMATPVMFEAMIGPGREVGGARVKAIQVASRMSPSIRVN